MSGATRTLYASKSVFDAVEMLHQNVSCVRILDPIPEPNPSSKFGLEECAATVGSSKNLSKMSAQTRFEAS